VVVDALQRQQPMYRDASAAHLLSAGFGVVMLGFVAMSLLTGARAPAVLHVGLYSPALLGMYLLALRGEHAHEQQAVRAAVAAAGGQGLGDSGIDKGREWRRFALAALVVLVVLAAGTWLPQVGDALAPTLGLSRSFVGTVFMAVVTTLPEMAVTVAALRLGALDLAIGNLLGTNLFNVLVLAVDELFCTPGPLLAAAAPVHAGTAVTALVHAGTEVTALVHAGTAVTALVMTGVVIIGLVMRPQGRVLRVLSWVSVGLVAAHVINAALAFLSVA